MKVDQTHNKLKKLKTIIRDMGSVAVAFSGGTDSTFLVKVAHEVLGDKAAAVTARSASYPLRELRQAEDFAKKTGIRHAIIDSEELDIEGFSNNPVNRCYLCKKELFSKILDYAEINGLKHIVDGSNVDDLGDYRPGMLAIQELGVRRPLMEAGLGKEDIRTLSREMGLPTWDKPAFACLSSRFPYGQMITVEKLGAIDELEQFLLDLGCRQVRVRCHGDLARIEVAEGERARFFDIRMMDMVHEKFRAHGFIYVALDLKGYRTGSMNEPIIRKESKR
jgi:uncharacterized protein